MDSVITKEINYYRHPIIEEWWAREDGEVFERTHIGFKSLKRYDHDMGSEGEVYDQFHLPEAYQCLYGGRNVILKHKIAYESFANVTIEQKDGIIRHINKNVKDCSIRNLRFQPKRT